MSVAACNCDNTQSTEAVPDLIPAPLSVNYGQVCNDSTQNQIVTITNSGLGSGNYAITFEGPDAALFSADPATGVLASTGSKVDVTVTYTPTADAGAQPGARHAAEMVLTYNGPDSPKKIALDGLVSTNKVEPLSSFACGDEAMKSCAQATPGDGCCSKDDPMADGFVGLKTLSFGDIDVGATGRIPLKALNKGCGTLNVTGVEFNLLVDECGENVLGVEGTLPATIAGSADHNAPGASDLELTFRPTDVCTLVAEVTITTDDPSHPTEKFSLTASGSEPKISATPDSWSFGEICAPEEGQKSFNIRNTGNKAITLNSVEIDPATSHFEIEKVEIVGCDDSRTEVTTWPHELVPSDSMPSCGNDEVVVDVRFRPEADCGRETAKILVDYGAGTIEIDLLGGSNPAIVVKPDSALVFSPPNTFGDGSATDCAGALDAGFIGVCSGDGSCTAPDSCLGESGTADGLCTSADACLDICGVSYKPFQVCNEGDASLAVGQMAIVASGGLPEPTHPDTGAPLFAIVANGCLDASLAKGECCEATLQYSNTNVGLTSFATLQVHSDDPLYPDGFEVSVQAVSTQDHEPGIDVRQTDPLGAKVETWVRIDGSLSSDEDGQEIQRFTWTLKRHPGVAGANKWSEMVNVPLTAGMDPKSVCPAEINGGDCFRCVDSRCRAIDFWPTLHTEGAAVYEWNLKVESGYCEPLLDNEANLNVVASE